jgi:hypothetical protein
MIFNNNDNNNSNDVSDGEHRQTWALSSITVPAPMQVSWPIMAVLASFTDCSLYTENIWAEKEMNLNNKPEPAVASKINFNLVSGNTKQPTTITSITKSMM